RSERLLPGGANAYPAFGLSCCCRVAQTLTRPTVRAAVAVGAHPYPAYGPSRCCRVALTLTRPTVREAVAGWR
ncbi:hypothetical protein ACVGV7_12230, partial [Enterobacter intestinihominis]